MGSHCDNLPQIVQKENPR